MHRGQPFLENQENTIVSKFWKSFKKDQKDFH